MTPALPEVQPLREAIARALLTPRATLDVALAPIRSGGKINAVSIREASLAVAQADAPDEPNSNHIARHCGRMEEYLERLAGELNRLRGLSVPPTNLGPGRWAERVLLPFARTELRVDIDPFEQGRKIIVGAILEGVYCPAIDLPDDMVDDLLGALREADPDRFSLHFDRRQAARYEAYR